MTKSPLENWFICNTQQRGSSRQARIIQALRKYGYFFKPPWAIHTTHSWKGQEAKTCTKHDTKQVQLGFSQFACLGNTQLVEHLGEQHQEQLLIHTCFIQYKKSRFKGPFFIQVNPIYSSTSNAPTYHLTKKSQNWLETNIF